MEENIKKKRRPSVDEVIEILGILEKPFNDMIDWHIAYFQEQDKKKQELYYAISESKRVAYEKLQHELFKQYEQ